MSNRAIWNVRKRHEWLDLPQKSQHVKRRGRLRNGMQDAIDRSEPEADEAEAGEQDQAQE